MRNCCVEGCTSKYSFHQSSNKIALFSFPKDAILKQAWINAIGHGNQQSIESEKLISDARVCEKHFPGHNVFYHNCRSTLLKGSVPTIFPNSDGVNMEYLLPEKEENVVDFTKFLSEDSRFVMPNKDTQSSESEKISAPDFFFCENCGHKNNRHQLITSKKRRNSDINSGGTPESSKKFMSEYAQQSPIEHQLINEETRFPVDGNNHADWYRTDATLQTSQTSTADLNSSLPAQYSASLSEYKQEIPISLYQPINPELRFPCDETESSVHNRPIIIAETPAAPKARPRRLYFPGDVPCDTDLTPRSSKKYIASLRKVVTKQSHKIKITTQKIRRQRKTIVTMKTLLEDLKTKNMISDNAFELLQCGGETVMQQLEKGRVNNGYPPEVRSFALTLHFYSPRAYRYVRQKFKNKLPAPRTIRKWCESVNGDPGITKEALNVLAVKIKDSQEKGIQLRFCMAVDEMSIRKQIEFNFAKKKYFGYVDFGGNDIDRDNTVAATKAWVIMLTALNANFKIPVAYYLTNGLNAKEQASIVNGILRVLHETHVTVVALVFDGASTNVSMVNQLNRKVKNPTYFLHPVTGERIHILWDICHMLKLVRNTLAKKGTLHDAQGRAIEWRYIRMLHEIQEQHRIRLGNKLTKQHVLFNCKKMSVRLAAQTLSRSVADALEVLQEKNPAFKECCPTITFIRTFNRLFDICNSKSKFGKYNKRPIDSTCAKETFNFFTTAAKYILGLKLHKQKIVKTKSYTGFFGFLQSMSSIHNLYTEQVKNGPMSYLLTFKLSQDHLETFFASIRSRHGFNNNPNAIQFRSAYKQLIIHNEVSSPSTANCINLDNTNILTVPSTSRILGKTDVEENEFYDPSILSTNFKNAIASHGLHDVVSEAVIYIAGFVERSIRRKLICSSCISALDENPMMGGTLIDKKNFRKYGGLCTPRQAVVVLCRLAEKNIQIAEGNKELSQNKMYLTILNRCMRDVPTKLLGNMEEHIKDCDPLENHRYLLIRSILEEYLKVKLYYIGKLQTMDMHSNFIRWKNNKLTQFKGQ